MPNKTQPVVVTDNTTRVLTRVIEVSGATVTEDAGRAVITITGGGGGGASDHALLSHLAWTASAHTGTANRFAVFGSGGAAAELAYPSTGLVGWTGSAWQAVTVSAPLGYSAGALSLSYSTGLTTSGGALVVDTTTIATLSAVAAAYQPLDSDLTALAAVSSNGFLVRTGSGAAAARSLAGGAGVSISNADGVSGNPTIDVEPGFQNTSYYHQWMSTDGVTLSGSISTFTNGTVSYTILGTSNFPHIVITQATVATVGVRSNSASFALAQGLTHRFQIVTGSNKTSVRWRIGLAAAGFGTALKPASVTAMVVFDPDSGQANATANWYLLTYDNGGGAVTYVDTGVACNVDTAYEIEIIAQSASVAARVRLAGGTWGSTTTSTTSLPASSTLMFASMYLTPTTASSRTLNFRKWSCWKEYS